MIWTSRSTLDLYLDSGREEEILLFDYRLNTPSLSVIGKPEHQEQRSRMVCVHKSEHLFIHSFFTIGHLVLLDPLSLTVKIDDLNLIIKAITTAPIKILLKGFLGGFQCTDCDV